MLLRLFSVILIAFPLCSCSDSFNSLFEKLPTPTNTLKSQITTYMKDYYPKIEVSDVILGRKVGKCTMFKATAVENGEELIGVTTMSGKPTNDHADLQILSYRSIEAGENLIYNMCGEYFNK